MTREGVYNVICTERDYQDKLWSNDQHSVGDWLVFMRHYLTEAEKRFSKDVIVTPTLEEIRKVAALAVACMEQHETPARK